MSEKRRQWSEIVPSGHERVRELRQQIGRWFKPENFVIGKWEEIPQSMSTVRPGKEKAGVNLGLLKPANRKHLWKEGVHAA